MYTFLRRFLTAIRGRSQAFLGFHWIRTLLMIAPASKMRGLALRLLDLSPHYFYRSAENLTLRHDRYLESEFWRNRDGREQIIDAIVDCWLTPETVALDYGCGPGFLAYATASRVSLVYACDISAGVLACAEAVNCSDNINYVAIENGRIPVDDACIDIIYTFAVIQHVTNDVFAGILQEWMRVLRPGGTVLCHVVLDDKGWTTEAQWRNDSSLRGRAKWLAAMHCFTRSQQVFADMVAAAGFSLPRAALISGLAPDLADDIAGQHLAIFEKVAVPVAVL